jgi:DNA-binding MarR family transcriptional regulator
MSHQCSTDRPSVEGIKRLLARTPVISSACELDLLVFFHRHPRALLTSEQVAAFLGYDMKKIAKAIEAFVEGGLLERTQNPTHAARLYVLTLNDPPGGGLTRILELASTRLGRQQILDLLGPGQSENAPDAVQGKRRLHAIA